MNRKMKKALSLILALLLFVTLQICLPAASLNVSAETTATVTGDSVNVRSGPGTDYSAIAVLTMNMTVTVLDTSNSAWYKIRTPGGIEGYMSSEFLEFGTTTTEPTYQYAKTTTAVNLRSGAGTGYSVIRTLSTGEYVTVLEITNSEWVKVETSYGETGYLYSEYITYVSGNSGTITLSQTSVTIPKGKTVILEAWFENYGTGVYWSSANTSIAKVSGGFVYAAGVGETIIIVKDSSGLNSATCTVKVTAPEVAKFLYSSPNIACINEEVQLVAVTDTSPDKMRFVVHGDTDQTYETSSYTSESAAASGRLAANNTRIWSKKVTFSKPGTYNVDVYSRRNGTWGTNCKTMTVSVASTQDYETTSLGERRPSDRILTIIANFEGFCETVYDDPYVSNAPTIGHGHVLTSDEQFYDNLTRREAWAMLCSEANTQEYTTKVNECLQKNNVKVSQQQFDCLFSFSYNIGGWRWMGASEFTLRDLMLNSVDFSALDFENTIYNGEIFQTANVYNSTSSSSPATYLSKGTPVTVTGTKTVFSDKTHAVWYKINTAGWLEFESGISAKTTANLNVRTGPGDTYSVKTVISSGSTVSVLDMSNSQWYKIKTSAGTTGYVKSKWLELKNAVSAKTTANLKIRTGPGDTYSLIKVLSSGSTVEILNPSNPQWYKIKTSAGTVGYVNPRWLELKDTVSAKTTANLKIRTGPGDTYSLIKVLSSGSTVEILNSSNPQWYKIKTSAGTVGYVNPRWLDLKNTVSAKTTANLKIRTGPGDTYSQITVLSSGSSVEILNSSDPQWYKIKTSAGTVGYVNPRWLDLKSTVSGKTTANLKIRSGPGETYSQITVLNSGSTVEILNSSDPQWYKIKTSAGTVGYVNPRWLTLNGAAISARTKTSLNVRSGAGDNYSVITTLGSGSNITILSTSDSGWYWIKTSSGTVGYVNSGSSSYYIKNVYVTLDGSFARDLLYCDAIAFGSELLEWHHAGGVCVRGLLYRRLAEAKIFSFGNYDEANMSNPNYTKNTYGYSYPSCIS